jgi:hypothetical protein
MTNHRATVPAQYGIPVPAEAQQAMSWPQTLWMYMSPGILVLIVYLIAVEHLWQPQNWLLIIGLAIMLNLAVLRWRTIWVGYT